MQFAAAALVGPESVAGREWAVEGGAGPVVGACRRKAHRTRKVRQPRNARRRISGQRRARPTDQQHRGNTHGAQHVRQPHTGERERTAGWSGGHDEPSFLWRHVPRGCLHLTQQAAKGRPGFVRACIGGVTLRRHGPCSPVRGCLRKVRRQKKARGPGSTARTGNPFEGSIRKEGVTSQRNRVWCAPHCWEENPAGAQQLDTKTSRAEALWATRGPQGVTKCVGLQSNASAVRTRLAWCNKRWKARSGERLLHLHSPTTLPRRGAGLEDRRACHVRTRLGCWVIGGKHAQADGALLGAFGSTEIGRRRRFCYLDGGSLRGRFGTCRGRSGLRAVYGARKCICRFCTCCFHASHPPYKTAGVTRTPRRHVLARHGRQGRRQPRLEHLAERVRPASQGA
ncbi:hypothetical protein ACS15_3614 [Ralstonia insidiosa]|uniref:Uncharacterized protein n=1 Tax=Ralstonia insidiosa TaxID=190721 RepID=A0AAC9BCW5_9RALS|nr:hypothetical protein ACS15_3614 [Ralstonia insidiosa]